MKRHFYNPILRLLLALGLFAPRQAAAVATLTSTDGDFGTVSSQPTISGTNNITMGTNGTISYPAVASGPATGTVAVFTVGSVGGAGQMVDIACDATGQITDNTVGNGAATLNVTEFRYTFAAGSQLGPGLGTLCKGIGVTSSTATMLHASDLIYVDATINMTHPKFVGTYKMSSSAGGEFNLGIHHTTAGSWTFATADLSITFASLMSITSTTAMDFGKIIWVTPVTAAHADLGTNNNLAFTPNFSSATGGSTGVAGAVTFSNVQNGVTVDIYCDSSATLSNGSGVTIKVTGIKAVKEGSTGTYAGAGSACNGSAGALATTMVYNTGTADTFYLGGKLDGSQVTGTFASGVYSTSKAGGVAVTVILVNE